MPLHHDMGNLGGDGVLQKSTAHFAISGFWGSLREQKFGPLFQVSEFPIHGNGWFRLFLVCGCVLCLLLILWLWLWCHKQKPEKRAIAALNPATLLFNNSANANVLASSFNLMSHSFLPFSLLNENIILYYPSKIKLECTFTNWNV